jgi:uncharacterized protein (DUF58 family)
MVQTSPSTSKLGRYLDARVLSRLAHMRLKPRGRVYGDLAGDHKSPLLGFAVEFAGHRQYVPGDDIKHIDWRAYYKQGRYYLKQYEAETNLVAHTLLDCSESMRYGEGAQQKWDYAATLAVTLTHLVVAKRDKMSLGLFDEKVVRYWRPSQALRQVWEIDKVLSEHAPTAKTDLARVMNDFASRFGRRQVVMVLSDFFDDVDNVLRGLQRFRHAGHDVIVFHILHRDELAFPFDGNVRFEGFEGMGIYKTDAQQIREGYRKSLEAYLERFAKGCEGMGAEYVLMDTSVPVEVSLARLLAGRMRRR